MADYISREAVEQVLRGIANGLSVGETEALKTKGLKALYKIQGAKEILNSVDNDLCFIPAADVQPVDRWISVDERLPKTGESVLVYVAINKNLKGFGECKPEIRIGWLDDGGKWALQFSNMDYSEVLCWLPLPELPSYEMCIPECKEGYNAQIAEYKRLLKAAAKIAKNLPCDDGNCGECVHNDNGYVCSEYECFEWRYADEALALIGEDGEQNG